MPSQPSQHPNDARVHAVVVTYRRNDQLGRVLDGLHAQSVRPASVTVVDNADDPAAQDEVLSRPQHRYVPAGENLGPAGGLALGFTSLEAAEDGWVLFVDDDDPPPHEGVLGNLLALIRSRAPDERLGGVGLVGARYSRRTGLVRRIADEELDGVVAVDYVGGNQFPMYSVAALRDVGPMRADLFFGLEELELGLRLRAAGYRILVDGSEWLGAREKANRIGLTPRSAASGRARSDWRRYYTVRNQVWVAREHGRWTAPLVCSARSGVAGAVADGLRARSPRSTAPALRGLVDGWRGRLGRTLDPAEASGEPPNNAPPTKSGAA